jgi:adenine-specific DNA-methyltransferase
MAETQEELAIRVRELQKEVDRLNAQLKEKRFGLTWIDVPEAFEQESENKISVLEEVPELAIHNKDGKPTHILIEGDNYHALTCLNYTHRGKVDVIYIDPPYNTGNDGFVYRDKRFLDKFPDGTQIPKNHPLRHSAWLSFVEKRLRLGFELLSDNGVIFISIDDVEQARLKLLCDQIIGEEHFAGDISWQRSYSPRNDSKGISAEKEHILVYSKNTIWTPKTLPRTAEMDSKYKNPDNDFAPWRSSRGQ